METRGNLDMVRRIDDGAPQHDPRTHTVSRTWVEQTVAIDNPQTDDEGNVIGPTTEVVEVATYELVERDRATRVDEERDRRLQTFTFGGVLYDFDEVSRNRIDKARGSALAAIIAGAVANDLRWADANNDFGWIAADNSFNTMDAQTALVFGNAAASWEGLHIVAARTLKNMDPIPADFTNDSYWPSA